jgi:transcriptional regulator with XRE-family HTH domain
LNLSQEAVAKAIEKSHKVRLSAAYLSMIENGVKTNLTVKLINALLAHFNLPLNAASSLFIQAPPLPAYAKTESSASFREAIDEYPVEEPQLPEEARQALKEFRDFLHYKYDENRKLEQCPQIPFSNR